MIHNENAEHWAECWRSSLLQSDFISDEMQAERWNKRADDFARDVTEARSKKKTDEFFSLLREAGFSPEGATILDIGCGPGSISLPLARAGAKVIALDISTGMLNRLKASAEEEDLDITPIECSWWTADIDKLGMRNRFDLVVASMTPGIRDVESFDRMMACSKRYCYYSNYIKADPEKIPKEIYIRILKKAPANTIFASGFLYPFMYLYTLGIQPVVKIKYKSVKRDQNWLEAAEKAIDFFQLTQPISTDVKGQIRDYYRDHASEGIYNADYIMYTGMMVWSNNGPDTMG